jgi:hypothetical protein
MPSDGLNGVVISPREGLELIAGGQMLVVFTRGTIVAMISVPILLILALIYAFTG